MTLVVAHRGASYAEPEHTREAYELAVREGADAFECDVRLTRDGHLVLVHDALIDRTSTGRGSVSRMSLAELDAHRYPNGRPAASQDSYRVMTLDALIEIADSAPRRVGLSIETKHPTVDSHRLEDSVIDVLERAGRAGIDTGTRIMSFSRAALDRARHRSSLIPLVYLFDAPPLAFRDGGLPAGVSIAGPSIGYLREDPEYVSRLHDHGHQVHVWTVDDPRDVELCVTTNVDAIITNRPGAVAALIGRTP
jgi:glycerophosphoryl diester phosphodiesterase